MFSKIYLRLDYHNLKIRVDDIPKDVFQTYYGHYKFLVTSFGLPNAPTTFISSMNGVLKSFMDSFIIVIINDILVYS